MVVIQKRMSYIQSLCPLSDDNPPGDIEQIYYELLELARWVRLQNVNSRLDSDHCGTSPQTETLL
jgi:hypothetical protein